MTKSTSKPASNSMSESTPELFANDRRNIRDLKIDDIEVPIKKLGAVDITKGRYYKEAVACLKAYQQQATNLGDEGRCNLVKAITSGRFFTTPSTIAAPTSHPLYKEARDRRFRPEALKWTSFILLRAIYPGALPSKYVNAIRAKFDTVEITDYSENFYEIHPSARDRYRVSDESDDEESDNDESRKSSAPASDNREELSDPSSTTTGPSARFFSTESLLDVDLILSQINQRTTIVEEEARPPSAIQKAPVSRAEEPSSSAVNTDGQFWVTHNNLELQVNHMSNTIGSVSSGVATLQAEVETLKEVIRQESEASRQQLRSAMSDLSIILTGFAEAINELNNAKKN
jgi:hypothetical protein